MSEIRHNDRVLCMGKTGSGKSELLNTIGSGLIAARGAQVGLIDTKPEYALPGPDGQRLAPVSDVSEIDWAAPVFHYQTSAPSPKEIDRLFNVLQHRKRLTVIVHELSDLCDYSAGKTPGSVNGFLSKGRAHGLGMYGGTQRPVNIPKRMLTDAEHVFVFATGFTAKADMDNVSIAMGMPMRELQTALAETLQTYGEHAFLHFDRRDGRTTVCPPLTDAERAGIIVESPTLF